jgi:hypothetical protein
MRVLALPSKGVAQKAATPHAPFLRSPALTLNPTLLPWKEKGMLFQLQV